MAPGFGPQRPIYPIWGGGRSDDDTSEVVKSDSNPDDCVVEPWESGEHVVQSLSCAHQSERALFARVVSVESGVDVVPARPPVVV